MYKVLKPALPLFYWDNSEEGGFLCSVSIYYLEY